MRLGRAVALGLAVALLAATSLLLAGPAGGVWEAAAAAAADLPPAPVISLGAYRERLEAVAANLDRALQSSPQERDRQVTEAADLAGQSWAVEAPGGRTTADMRPLQALLNRSRSDDADGRKALEDAARVARSHLAGVQVDPEPRPTDLTGARARLTAALAETRSGRWLDRLFGWLAGLLGTSGQSVADAAEGPAGWIAGLLALAGVGYFTYSLWRGLSGHGAGSEALLASGLVSQAARPRTPAELRALASTLAGAGQHRAALQAAQLAALRYLDELRLLRYAPTRTNREHERELRQRHRRLAAMLGELDTLVEARLFSGQPATAADSAEGERLLLYLWREGEAASKQPEATNGVS